MKQTPPEADPKTEFEFQQELELNKLQVQKKAVSLGTFWLRKRQGGDPASDSTVDTKHKRLGSLEAAQLVTFNQQAEHSLQASIQPHEPSF